MGNRAQSAMEYLTTYGWAILVIAIVIVVLIGTGVFSSQKFIGNTCTFSANFGCSAGSTYMSSRGTLYINFEQSVSSPINITAIGCNTNQTVKASSVIPNIYLRPGQNTSFAIECYNNNLPFNGIVGTVFKGYVIVNYTNLQTGLPATVTGTVIEKVTSLQNTGLLTIGSITASNAVVDVGEYETINAVTLRGTSPYTYNFFVVNSISHSTIVESASYSNIVPASDTFTYQVTQSDNTNSPEKANSVVTDSESPHATASSSYSSSITVNNALVASNIIPSNPSIDNGQYIILISNPSGGTLSYGYKWYMSTSGSPACSNADVMSQTSNSISTNPTTNTLYTYQLTDSASTPVVLCSGSDTVTVNPALGTPTLTPSNILLDAGQWETYNALWSGGTSTYTANFYNITGLKSNIHSGISALSNSLTFQTSSSSTGSLNWNVSITDSAYSPVTKNSITNTIKVSAALGTPTLSPSTTQTINYGGSVGFSSSETGGTTPYSYQWRSGSSGCTSSSGAASGSSTGTSYTASPSTVTYYCLTATDSATTAESATSATTEVFINPPSLDGNTVSETGGCTPNVCVTLTTSKSPDVIIVATECGGTISDTAGLSWTERESAGYPGDGGVIEYYAIAPSPLTNDKINDLSGTSYCPMMAFGISGADTSSPFDPNAALPATASGSGVYSLSNTISTSNPSDFIFQIAGTYTPIGAAPTQPSGFTQLNYINIDNDYCIEGGYETVTSIQSSVAITTTWPDCPYYGYGYIVDAVQS